jgi:hypothetical protein
MASWRFEKIGSSNAERADRLSQVIGEEGSSRKKVRRADRFVSELLFYQGEVHVGGNKVTGVGVLQDLGMILSFFRS